VIVFAPVLKLAVDWTVTVYVPLAGTVRLPFKVVGPWSVYDSVAHGHVRIFRRRKPVELLLPSSRP
jgi:hypothetical protein